MGMINIEYLAGTNFKDAIIDARRVMNTIGCYVKTNFNGVSVTIMGFETTPEDATEIILEAMGEEHKFAIVK